MFDYFFGYAPSPACISILGMLRFLLYVSWSVLYVDEAYSLPYVVILSDLVRIELSVSFNMVLPLG